MGTLEHIFSTARKRWWARLLLAVMLLAALAPTFSRAMAAQQDTGNWVELCTSAGMRWVSMGGDGVQTKPTDPQNERVSLDACDYCLLATERFAPMLPSLPAVIAHAPPWDVPAFVPPQPTTPTVPRHAARDPPL